MKTTIISALIVIICFLSSCKTDDPLVSERQKVFDELKGDWVISEVSEAYWERMTTNVKSNLKFEIKESKVAKLVGSELNFKFCDAKGPNQAGTMGVTCFSEAKIFSKNCSLIYSYENEKDLISMYAGVPTAPGVALDQIEKEIFYILTASFKYEVSATQLKLTTGLGGFTDDKAFIILKKQ